MSILSLPVQTRHKRPLQIISTVYSIIAFRFGPSIIALIVYVTLIIIDFLFQIMLIISITIRIISIITEFLFQIMPVRVTQCEVSPPPPVNSKQVLHHHHHYHQ